MACGSGTAWRYLAALLLRGLLLVVADASRAPLTLTVSVRSGSRFATAVLDVRIERVGRSLTSVSARLTQDNAPVALALAIFVTELRGLESDELPMPEIEPPWPDRRSVISEQAPRFLVLQPRFGRPFQSRPDPVVAGGWTGLQQPRRLDFLSLALSAPRLHT